MNLTDHWNQKQPYNSLKFIISENTQKRLIIPWLKNFRWNFYFLSPANNWCLTRIDLYQPGVAFHIETGNLFFFFCSAKTMTGFYISYTQHWAEMSYSILPISRNTFGCLTYLIHFASLTSLTFLSWLQFKVAQAIY